MHRIILLTVLFFTVVALHPPQAQAQATTRDPRLVESSRIRIRQTPTSPAERFTVLRVVGDTLVLFNDIQGQKRMAIRDAAEIQIYAGRKSAASRAGGGALRGGIIGVAVGAVVGLIDGDDPPGIVSFSAGEKAFLAGTTIGAAGVVVGALVGLSSSGEQWERLDVAIRSLRPSPLAGSADSPVAGAPGLTIGYSVPR